MRTHQMMTEDIMETCAQAFSKNSYYLTKLGNPSRWPINEFGPGSETSFMRTTVAELRQYQITSQVVTIHLAINHLLSLDPFGTPAAMVDSISIAVSVTNRG